MRFMMITLPKDYVTAKPGWVPDVANMEEMRKYNEELSKAGVLLALDGLTPPATMSARVTFKDGKSKVTDGPFPEAKEVVGGYWVIDVKSREEALQWASRIPGRDTDLIEVRRFFDLSDFGADAQKNIEEMEKRHNDAGINVPGQ
ncbi:MAG TPA: YciI family protein [Candidatus Acidoferrales bacterium]